MTTANLFLALSEVFVKFGCYTNINNIHTILRDENYDPAFVGRKM